MIRIFAELYAKEHGLPFRKIGRSFRNGRTPLRWLVVIMLWVTWFSFLYITGFYARYLWLRYSPPAAGQKQETTQPDYYLSPQQYIAKKQLLPQPDVASESDEEIPAVQEDGTDGYVEESGRTGEADAALRQRVREALRMSEKAPY